MSDIGSTSGAAALSRIISRDVAKAARGAVILFIVNSIIVIVFDLAIFAVRSPFVFFTVSGYSWLADTIAAGLTLYAFIAFLLSRHKQGPRLGLHFYVLGLLGLSIGAIFFSWGALQFLSAGYWLRRYSNAGMDGSARNGDTIAVYGDDSLVNVKSSQLIRIGWDLPKSWSIVGLVALATGVVLFFLGSMIDLSIGPVSMARIGWILFIDGLSFMLIFLVQRTGFTGYVRLPPSEGQANA